MFFRVLILSFLISLSQTGQAEIKADYFALPEVVAIEDRQYDNKYELSLAFGYFPSNAYNRYFSGSAAVAYKLTPTWSWEILRYDIMREEETNLKSELQSEFAIDVQSPTFGGRFLPMTGIARTSVLWEPFYNKGLFANSSLVYSNLSVLFSAGNVSYKSRDGQFMFGLGGIYKVYLDKTYSVKVDVRQNFVLDSVQGTTDFTELSIGLNYHFGGVVTR